MINWQTQTARPDSIVDDRTEGRYCKRACVTSSDHQIGMWGSTAERELFRATLAESVTHPRLDHVVYKFALFIPIAWDLVGRTNILGVHSTLAEADPVDLELNGANFVWCQRFAEIGQHIPVERGRWYDGDIDIVLSEQAHGPEIGSLKITFDGQLVYQMTGQTIGTADSHVYWKIGPYVFEAWPAGVTSREFCFQV